MMLQPSVEEEEARVIGNETGTGDTGIIFQKAKAELFSAPEVDIPFNISDPAVQSNPIMDNRSSVIARHGPTQIRSDTNFTFPAHEHFAETCFTHLTKFWENRIFFVRQLTSQYI
jgi:hypothetical protein